jgi:hypothetical protein
MKKIVIVLGALALAAPAFAGEKEQDKTAEKKPAKKDEKAPAKAGEKPSDGKTEEKPHEK